MISHISVSIKDKSGDISLFLFTFSRHFCTRNAVAAMPGADQQIMSSLGSVLPKSKLTCRPGELNH